MGHNHERLQARIFEVLSNIVATELLDPRLGLVTVTRVKLSSDFRYAKVFVASASGEDEDTHMRTVLRGMEHAKGHVQTQLARRLRMRLTPLIEFEYDTSLGQSFRIHEILREIKEEDEGPEVDPLPEYEVYDPDDPALLEDDHDEDGEPGDEGDEAGA